MFRLIVRMMMLGLVAGGGFAGWYYFGGGYDTIHNTAYLTFQREIGTLERRAERGEAAAWVELGRLYGDPANPFADPETAAEHFGKAARAGDPDGQAELGYLYEQGIGVSQDFLRAAELYGIAAKTAGHVDAQFRLADMYFHGRGFANDYDAAIRLYGAAARRGHVIAQYLYGIMHKEGWGVRRNAEEAYFWLSLAAQDTERVKAENPKYDPVHHREQLLVKLNRTQINRANRKVQQFLGKS